MSLVIVCIWTFLSSTFGLPSCVYPPCKYNVIRYSEDMTGIYVVDNSNHSISWAWEVRGGKWRVSYKSSFPGGWYEGKATFTKYSTEGREQAFVSWGNGREWESNAVPIYANAWNISYNGDVFGFAPTGNGRYIFKIYSKNKRHNPFGDDIRNPPSSCSLSSSDKNEMARWWAQRKAQRNCAECVLNWNWNANRGRWKVVYKWIPDSDRTVCSVWYRSFVTSEEMEVIHLTLDEPLRTVSYRANPMRIPSESPWELNLSPAERWSFKPTSNGQWIFQQYSRNIIFRPFNSFSGTMNIE